MKTFPPKQQLFIKEYLVDLNATQAALRAGYSKKSAAKIGPQLLEKTRISEEIRKERDKRAERVELTADNVLDELRKVVTADPRSAFRDDGTLKPPKEWPDDLAGAISGMDVTTTADGETVLQIRKIRMHSKTHGVDMALKHLGLYSKDNEQKNGALSGLDRSLVKAIVDRLKKINAEHQ